MRLLVATLVVLASVPALAQSQYAEGPGAYVALESFDTGAGRLQQVDGAVGARFANGVDAGLRLGYSAAGGSYGREFSGGPTVGVSWPLGKGFEGRVEGALRYAAMNGDAPTVDRFSGRSAVYHSKVITEDVTATVSRSVRVVGSVRLRPAIGVYATSIQTLDGDLSRVTGFSAGTPAGRAGLHLHVPVSFRLFGADAVWAPTVFRLTIVPHARLQGVNDEGYYERLAGMEAFAGSGFRLNL